MCKFFISVMMYWVHTVTPLNTKPGRQKSYSLFIQTKTHQTYLTFYNIIEQSVLIQSKGRRMTHGLYTY